MLRPATSVRHLPVTAGGAVAERQVIQRIYLALTASDPRTVGAAGGLAEPGWRSDMADHTCAQCGDVFDRLPGATGQGASWCTPVSSSLHARLPTGALQAQAAPTSQAPEAPTHLQDLFGPLPWSQPDAMRKPRM